MNINRVMLAGNLTRDPQVKFLANERAVAQFGLAVNRRWKDRDGVAKEDVTFVDIEAWGRTAELAGQYLVKGSPVFLEGRLKLDSWDDKDGKRQSRLRVVADSIQFLNSKRADRPEHEQPAEQAVPSANSTQPTPVPSTPSASQPRRPTPIASGLATDDEPPF